MDSPVVAGDVVYVGSYDHKIYALNASTGASIWSYETGSCVLSPAAVVDGIVYVYYGGGDHVIGLATCRLEELLDFCHSG